MKSHKECNHKAKKILSLSKQYIHEYCPECGWHKYQNIEYTKEKWFEKYIKE